MRAFGVLFDRRVALVTGLSTLLLERHALANPIAERADTIWAPDYSCTAELKGKVACGSRTMKFQCDGDHWYPPPGADCRTYVTGSGESQGQYPCCFAEDGGLNAYCEARQGDGQCRESTPFG